MKTRLLAFGLFLAAVTCLAPAACAGSTSGEGMASPEGEAVVVKPVQGDTIVVHSKKMGRDITNLVVKPEQYFACDTARFPVLYLLHGADGCYKDWSRKANLDSLATAHSVIIVCPDGQDSWYFDSPLDPKMQFETFISSELRQAVDSLYRTLADRKNRAITGLSMGGHGALWIAWRHPDLYGACGSMSGGVDITKFPDRWLIQKQLGPYATNKKRWADHAVINLVPHLKAGQQDIIIDDGYDDFFYRVNVNLHEALLAAKIPHDFYIRPGRHSWNYWVNSLDYHLLFFDKSFKRK